MRALVVYAHPNPESFTAAVRDLVLRRLEEAGAEVTLLDLYAEGFAPVLSAAEWAGYAEGAPDDPALQRHIAALKACDTLIFIYPTWWYGVPAILKGWLDRVLLPGVAFQLPERGAIEPGLRHIERFGVFTTCGASRWLTWAMGAPGKRMLMRGVRMLCAKRCRTAFAAHYSMSRSNMFSRAAHLVKVDVKIEGLLLKR
ncbi:NAD(P)H-dependent oxidoreductase [Oceanibium sediminis]|uniref:NAD(P)H-dependent oxidoreductase n=1 Tax=Oceanibium sediminis TaxID=2026339 RepID=UPI000DD36B4A|nr:NAD(P)H-dependent oxidoreductase [Oceanibium sediminis]